MRLTPIQCAMARAGLRMTARDLAAAASLGVNTVTRFERGQCDAEASTLRLLRQALEAGGAEFLGDDGVRIPRGSGGKGTDDG